MGLAEPLSGLCLGPRGGERGGGGASEGQQGQRRPQEGNGGQSLEGSKATTDSKHFTLIFVGSLWGVSVAVT